MDQPLSLIKKRGRDEINLIYYYFCYSIEICHLHTNLKKEKEPEAMDFWSDLELKLGKEFF